MKSATYYFDMRPAKPPVLIFPNKQSARTSVVIIFVKNVVIVVVINQHSHYNEVLPVLAKISAIQTCEGSKNEARTL